MRHDPSFADPGGELQRFIELVADLDAVIWEADARTMRFTFVSAGASRLLGYAPERWLGRETFWSDHVHPDDRERVVSQFVHASMAGWRFDTEYRFIANDGSIVWLRDVGHVVKDAKGSPTLVRGVMTDITRRRRGEREREEAEARLRRVVERAPAIVYIEAARGDPERPRATLYVGPHVEGVLGFTPREWMDDPAAREARLHPDDRERVRAEYARAERLGEPFSVEYRMLSRDERVVWFHDEAVLVRDDDGRPLYWQGIMFDVTAQRVGEAVVEENEARYRTFVERLPAIVYSEGVGGDRHHLVYINPRVEELLGISPEEWISDPDLWASAIDPDDRDRVLEANARTERSGEPFSLEYRMRARDGRVVWFRDEAVLVRDAHGAPRYWQGVMIDITAQKEAEAQLGEAEARYRALVEQTPAITYIDAVEGPQATLYISPQTTALLGYTPQDWYDDAQLWSLIVHPEDRERAAHADPSAGAHDATYRLIGRDGGVVWVHDQAKLIVDEQGRPKYWQGVLVDVTEQERAQELERDLALERETAQRLRELDDMKNTFLQAVSHDLRTPLAAIVGLAVTMAREDIEVSAAETRDMAGRIAQNARRLDRLVSDLLDLDRLSRGIVEPTFRRADVGELVRELVEGSEITAQRRVQLDTEPVVAAVDRAKVERIVENLLGNMLKHTPADTRVWVRVGPWEDGALIVVEDDGPGVPVEQRERIFEPFQQAGTASPGSPGVGVGLSLVTRFAELHDGSAWVEDRPGGGASFRVFLPAHPSGYRPGPDDGADGTDGADDGWWGADQPTETGSSSQAGPT